MSLIFTLKFFLFFDMFPFNTINIPNIIHIHVIIVPPIVLSPLLDSFPPPLQVYSCRHCSQQPPNDSIQMSTTVSPPTPTIEFDFLIALRKGIRFTRNLFSHYIALSYYISSSPFYTCLTSISFVAIPKSVSELGWRQTMVDELGIFIIVKLGSSSHYRMRNLLLVTSKFLLSKLVMMVLLIVLKPVLWPKVTHENLGCIMVIFFIE